MADDQAAAGQGPPHAERNAELIEAAIVQELGPQRTRPVQPRLPEWIGPYRIIRRIGAAGMGVVYEAEQTEPTRRVALKVSRSPAEAGSRDVVLFQREIEALARLHHPSIARIYVAGRTAGGQPYFVMELIDGYPLIDHCQEAGLPLRERLSLFARICQAVNYAHQRGVIHCDLKPGNILVDSEGTPHVLDFGLARILNPEVEVSRSLAAGHAMLGTLPYMSPEQTRTHALDIDMRTDVYSLGVILYEMLTGRYPYSVVGNVAEVLRNINEAEPVRPSSQYLRIDREVETIVLRALAKDRERRYSSVEALGRDVESYLSGRPIEAQRDRPLYVLKMMLRRHRLSVLTAGAFLVLILVGALTTTWLWRQAVRDRNLARQAQDQAVMESEARRRALYVSRIALADTEYRRPRIEKALQLLHDCPPDLRQWEWYRMAYICDQAVVTFRGHSRRVFSVAFRPDGRQLASGSEDGTVKVWDIAGSREWMTMRSHAGSVWSVAYSPDGKMLASGDENGEIILWNADTGAEFFTLSGPPGRVWELQFDPAGSRIVAACPDGIIRVWSLDSREEVLRLKSHDSQVASVAFSPDGSRIASSGYDQDRAVKLWDARSGAMLGVLNQEFWEQLGDGPPFRVVFSPDGTRVATCTAECSIWVRDSRTLAEKLSMRGAHESPIDALAYSPDGQWLAAGSRYGAVSLRNARNGNLNLSLRGHADRVTSVAFSPDGRRLASGSWDRTVKVWDLDAGGDETVLSLAHPNSTVTALAFSPDGQYLASGGADHNVQVWSATEWTPVTVLSGHADEVTSVAFGAESRRVVSASLDGHLRAWDVATGDLMLDEHQEGTKLHSICCDPRGAHVASGDSTGAVIIRDLSDGRVVARLHEHAGAVRCVAYSPDGGRLVSGGDDMTVRMWDAGSGKSLRTFTDHKVTVNRVAFSPDGARIASADADGSIMLWETQAAGPPLVLRGHRRDVTGLAFSPDGSRLFSTGRDGSGRIWDTRTGEAVLTQPYSTKPKPIYALALSPNGRTVVVGYTWGGGIGIWDSLPPQETDSLLGGTRTTQERVSSSPPVVSLGVLLHVHERIDPDAVAEGIMRARTVDTNDSRVQAQYALACGELLLVAGERHRALSAIRWASERGEGYDCYFKSLGWALLANGDRKGAETAFQRTITRFPSWSPPPADADPDHWTAAYFLNWVSEEQYTSRWRKDAKFKEVFACFPWFYVGQRMEIEGKRDAAIAAYRKSVEVGELPHAKYLGSWSAYRLRLLTGSITPSSSDWPASRPAPALDEHADTRSFPLVRPEMTFRVLLPAATGDWRSAPVSGRARPPATGSVPRPG